MGKGKRAGAKEHPVAAPRSQAGEEYFSTLRLRLKLGILGAFLVPLIGLSLYFHFQFDSTLKETGKLHLAALAESQKNTIDLFLQERVVNIFSLFRDSGFNTHPTPEDMARFMQNLRQTSDAFVDVGFCDSKGVQIGYAGPFPYLLGKDYSAEKWFVAVMTDARNYHISNIYLGFRNKPHFTIAVRQLIGAEPCIVRATLDPDKFYMFLRNISSREGVDSALIDGEGIYQIVDPGVGQVLTKGPQIPPEPNGTGVEEKQFSDDSILVAYARLSEVPWVLVVSQPLSKAYGRMYKARMIMIVSTALMVAILGLLVWKITNRLVIRAQVIAKAREELHAQLLHASKLASLGELVAGIAHEINNPLAIISATSGVIKDLFDPEFQLEWTPETIRNELATIESAVSRARGITHKLLDFSRKNPPSLLPCNVNAILDSVVEGLKEQEFQISDIELVRDYSMGMPDILLDPDQISQVFLNLINNAGDAIDRGGTITLITRYDDECVRVSVTDTGKGITSEQMGKIFTPFYTSKEVGKGTGLGLSVSLGIVESMRGKIEAQSIPGKGSSFTVVLPMVTAEDRVLLVDDDQDFTEALSAKMKSRGLGVDTVASGRAALEKIKEASYCAIILDLMMPEMDGIETLEHLRKENPDLQVILLTGHATIQVGAEAIKLGAMDCLEKPAAIDELMARIEKAKANRMLLFEKRVKDRIEAILGVRAVGDG